MNMCSLTGCKGGGGGYYAFITVIKIPSSHFMKIFKVKGKWMARPVQNAAVCRVNDESSLN